VTFFPQNMMTFVVFFPKNLYAIHIDFFLIIVMQKILKKNTIYYPISHHKNLINHEKICVIRINSENLYVIIHGNVTPKIIVKNFDPSYPCIIKTQLFNESFFKPHAT